MYYLIFGRKWVSFNWLVRSYLTRAVVDAECQRCRRRRIQRSDIDMAFNLNYLLWLIMKNGKVVSAEHLGW